MKKIPNIKYEIKPSFLINGVGLFSLVNFNKDSIVINGNEFKKTQFITKKEFIKLNVQTQSHILAFCPGNQLGFFVPFNLDNLPIVWYMNHSCTPNVGFDSEYNFVAMRNIKKGDELKWDYSFDEANPDFSFICKCGSKNCRKFLSGNDWKKYSLKDKNYKYYSPDLKNRIKHNVE